MFEFTRQTIINSPEYLGKQAVTGSEEKDTKKGLFVVLGYFKFPEDKVDSIFKREYRAGTPAEVTFDLSKITKIVDDPVGTYRFSFYIGLSMSSQDSFYANNLVYKGKPLYVEFPITKADLNGTSIKTDVVISKIKNIIKKYSLLYTDEDLLVVTSNGSEITFKGKYDYQIIKSAVLEKYNAEGGMTVACCSNLGEYEPVITGKILKKDETLNEPVETEIKLNVEAFGNYAWMIHNLRIPTGYNTRWDAPLQDEAPMAGGKYTQYTIHMNSGVRLGIAGEAVGMGVNSYTTHVFYVESALVEQFEDALSTAKLIGSVTTVDYDSNSTSSGTEGNNTSGNTEGNTGTQNP